MSIEFNPEFTRALTLIQDTNQNVFITGKAGTGKSTLLTYFREHTPKSLVVLAPTGVAALNVTGETIHSFFKFKPGLMVEDAIKTGMSFQNSLFFKQLKTIVIDEISMVRADLLDCVDQFLRTALIRNQPFAGIQMIFIGDLYQLPPVLKNEDKDHYARVYKSPYFFSAKVFSDPKFSLEYIELEKIYRQKDDLFISILNSIRNNSITSQQLALLNKNYNRLIESDEQKIYLTSTNAGAKTINQQKLNRLKTPIHSFEAEVTGKFDLKSAPTDIHLNLRVGAQVMFLMNHPTGFWVNGTIGKIIQIEDFEILIQTQDGREVSATQSTWKMYKYSYNQKQNRLTQKSIGSFTQFPLKLAWAVTIHKSQGKTFEDIILDLGSGTFAHGQLYVALSRCTSLKGIYLKQPISTRHILMDYRVIQFITQFQYQKANEKLDLDQRIQLVQNAIDSNQSLHITYLKTNDEKSNRKITPRYVGKMTYNGRNYLGMEAFCWERQDYRVFRVDRILSIAQHIK